MKFSIGKIRLTIGRKLALGFGIVLLLLVVSSVFAVLSLQQARNAAEEIVHAESVKEAADRMLLGKLSSATKLRHYFSTGDTKLLAESAEAHHLMEESLTTVKSYRAVALATELRAVEDAHYIHSDILDEATVAYRTDPSNVAAISAKLDEADTFFEQNMVSQLEAIREYEQSEMETTVASVQGLVGRMIIVAAVIAIIAFIVGVAAAYIIGRGITSAASQLSAAAAGISRGKMDVPIEVKTNDELEELGDSIERMRASLKAAIERLQVRRAAS